MKKLLFTLFLPLSLFAGNCIAVATQGATDNFF